MELNGQYNLFFGAFAKIYGLYDVNGNLFYVGCTTATLEMRLKGHLAEVKNSKKENEKIKRVKAIKNKISIQLIDMAWVTCGSKKSLCHMAKDLERRWIQKFLDDGIDLTNRKKTARAISDTFRKDYQSWIAMQKGKSTRIIDGENILNSNF